MITLRHHSVVLLPAWVLGVLGLGLGLAGCSATVNSSDPLRTLLDTHASTAHRLEAANASRQPDPLAPARVKAMQQLLWSPQQPLELREWAMREWTALDTQGFQKELRTHLPRVQQWRTLELLLEHIRQQGWRELTPAIVRQYAREVRNVPDEQRPERAVLDALNPGVSIEGLACELLADPGMRANLIERVAAWELLCRLMPRDRREAWLQGLSGASPLVVDLQTCLRDLRTLPTNREGVLWLVYLRDPSQDSRWDLAKQKVRQLTDQQSRSLELRHLTVLVNLRDEELAETPNSIRAGVRDRLSRARTHPTAAEHDAAAAPMPVMWDAIEQRLSWADLQTIRLLLRAIDQPEIRASLFSQADADQRDTTSEHAGVLDIRADAHASSFTSEPYEPLLRDHDRKFHAGPDMIVRLYTALAHYHFHAQQPGNAAYAGPGRGDLDFARRLNLTCLVLTFVDENTLNVDYYDPAGNIIDLGVLHR